MSAINIKPRLIQAVEALQMLDRDHAVFLLSEELREGSPFGDRWKSVATLASHIGELDIAIESARRYARTPPADLARILFYCGELASAGRQHQALAELDLLPLTHRSNPAILHFIGTCSSERGAFHEAEEYFRRAIAVNPYLPQTWFALAMIRKFKAGDPDIATMEQLEPQMAKAGPDAYARFLYGFAKAIDDSGDQDRAFELYAKGAALRRSITRFDLVGTAARAEQIIKDFTPEQMKLLHPSQCSDSRSIFVNGLPRSGTTLIEQILASHSSVTDGGELNLMSTAFLPAGDFSFSAALAYQQLHASNDDPWGDLARNYHHKLKARFGDQGHVVDKTLLQSSYMGLLLHSVPDAKPVWVRRSPDDTALSCYRTYFTTTAPWSWSLSDIGALFRVEDRLFNHWITQFPDRILEVRYEELVTDPKQWIAKILAHVGLSDEPQVYRPHETARNVRTASLQQVRSPISANRIGSARNVGDHLSAFRDAYGRST